MVQWNLKEAIRLLKMDIASINAPGLEETNYFEEYCAFYNTPKKVE